MQHTLDRGFVMEVIPARARRAHKGHFGRLCVVAGSSRYRGAALLAADGALRCGTGVVQLASTEAVCAAAAVRLPCCTLLPLAENAGIIANNAADAIDYSWPTALLAGCGLGNGAAQAPLIMAIAARAGGPLVLDADALNLLAGHFAEGFDADAHARGRAAVQAAKGPVVLTPHVGEAARLARISASEVQADPVACARALAAQWRAVVVLKDYRTVVAAPSGDFCRLKGPGNPGLAKGGSGDVLAGVVAGLCAQGIAAYRAAAAGVWLHHAAAAKAAEQHGEAGLSPAGLPEAIALALRDIMR